MKQFSLWIAERFIKNYKSVADLKVRARYGAIEGWTSVIGNTLLFAIKIITGLSIKSVALIADAVHTLADSATSVVIIVGFRMARKPSDKEHPFGHGRMEAVSALIVSVLLFVAGFELLKGSVHNIITPRVAQASWGIILLILATAAVKELMARFAYALGDIIDSQALRADALHHRSDVLATILVVVALIASSFGYNRLDGIMGVSVSLIIFYSAYSIGKEAINPLLGEAPSKQTIKEIEQLARSQEGVLGVHDIICNRYGSTSIVSLHIEVSDREGALRLHQLSETIEKEIIRKMGGMAVVHLDPINKDHPQYQDVAAAIKEIVAADQRVHSFHELRIVGCDIDRCNVIFDIALEQDTDEQENYDIIRSIDEKFRVKFPRMRVHIKAEPKYAYNL